ncbi:hypothetical protein BJY01DRAFT_182387 [Aspergillus pseudoustus]|uniref:YAG7-like dimerisation domain-containing protein n=1 Tax=Aspergillus pseudoustus TaxID=1810923 RepID=A0ABR4K2P4_9EURO
MPSDTAAQSPSPSEAKLNSVSGSTVPTELLEFTHYKELQKNLRNNTKRRNATAKVDAIIADHPDKSLEDLVAEGKINADQKAQALKKPALQAAITQAEEQISHYKELATVYEQRLAGQKAELEEAHKQEVESLKEKAAAAAAAVEVPEPQKEDFDQQLLSLSKFLFTAANLRRTGDASSPESRSFEGVLFQVYAGNLDAVASMKKLIDGVDEKISSVEGETLDVTYTKVKQLSEEQTPAEESIPEAAPATDPTLANAASTELDEPPAYVAVANDTAAPAVEAETIPPPPQTLVSDAANAVAEAAWEPHTDPLASSTNTEGFVEIPRDPAETDTGLQATIGNVDADVVTDASAEPTKATGDDFKQVVHHQRQGSFRRGRGRGRGDGSRGRGRGDGRGRGRGRSGRGRGGPNGAPAATPATQ